MTSGSVHLDLERVLPQRVRARRWTNDGPRAAFRATAHAGVEIAWIDDGGMRYAIGGNDYALAPGSVMLVPHGVEHASEFLEGMRGGSVHLDDALIAQAADAAGAPVPREAALLQGEHVRTLGTMLVDELARGGPDGQLCANALVDALAVKAVRGLPKPERASVRDPRVVRAIDLMRSRYAEPLDVDDIAAACGTSRFHLSRVFKAATGTSPYQYLVDVRVEEAARALRRGHSVTDAALSSGFADLSRFARTFARRFGVAPRVYATTHGASAASMSASSTTPSPSRS